MIQTESRSLIEKKYVLESLSAIFIIYAKEIYPCDYGNVGAAVSVLLALIARIDFLSIKGLRAKRALRAIRAIRDLRNLRDQRDQKAF